MASGRRARGHPQTVDGLTAWRSPRLPEGILAMTGYFDGAALSVIVMARPDCLWRGVAISKYEASSYSISTSSMAPIIRSVSIRATIIFW